MTERYRYADDGLEMETEYDEYVRIHGPESPLSRALRDIAESQKQEMWWQKTIEEDCDD